MRAILNLTIFYSLIDAGYFSMNKYLTEKQPRP